MQSHIASFFKRMLLLLLLAPTWSQAQNFVLLTGDTAPQVAEVSVSSTSDPAGHSCCVIAPPGLMEVFIEDGDLVVRENGGGNAIPWLDFGPMAIDGNFEFNGQNRSAVAGFSNVLSVITGSVSENSISAQVRIGAGGGLPTGQAITHNLFINPLVEAVWHFTEIQPIHAELGIRLDFIGVNIDEREIEPDSALDLFLSIDTGGETGDADWWLGLLNGDEISTYDFATGQFVPGLVPSYQGPLFDVLEPIRFLEDYAPPSDNFTIVFGVDRVADGELNVESLSIVGTNYYWQ